SSMDVRPFIVSGGFSNALMVGHLEVTGCRENPIEAPSRAPGLGSARGAGGVPDVHFRVLRFGRSEPQAIAVPEGRNGKVMLPAADRIECAESRPRPHGNGRVHRSSRDPGANSVDCGRALMRCDRTAASGS